MKINIEPMDAVKLKNWRLVKKNMTVDECSAMFGVDRATWYRWESGKISHPVLLSMAVRFLS